MAIVKVAGSLRDLDLQLSGHRHKRRAALCRLCTYTLYSEPRTPYPVWPLLSDFQLSGAGALFYYSAFRDKSPKWQWHVKFASVARWTKRQMQNMHGGW